MWVRIPPGALDYFHIYIKLARPMTQNAMQDTVTRFLLSESDIPRSWVNIRSDLPDLPPPSLDPVTHEPTDARDLAGILATDCIAQEATTDADVPIPDAVREVYKLWRPTPLARARRLERALKTPAHIYFKYEGVSPTGSHKPNTAVPQAYASACDGTRRLVSETGAGQWGSSLAFACSLFGLECEIFMVGSSYDQKPYRQTMMETWGTAVHRSPSDLTETGRAYRHERNGSLGIAISEATEVVRSSPETGYALGSVMDHVLLHQTVVGQEAVLQMEMAGESPDVVIGCVGGGSNFGGLAFPFLKQVLRATGPTHVRFLAAEPTACPTLTRGAYRYDYGDTSGLTHLMPMYTLGHMFVPAAMHAGGLRYHGDAPIISLLVKSGLVEARAYSQTDAFAAAVSFAKNEGIIPAPESAHALRAVAEEANAAREAGEKRVILVCLSGHGYFDLASYQAYLAGALDDPVISISEIERSLAQLPDAPMDPVTRPGRATTQTAGAV